jgi:hypothetical protein
MKTRSIIYSSILLAYTGFTFAQLKVTSNGFVGIGTNNPIGNLHIDGRLFLTGNGNTFRLLPNNPGTEFGSSTDHFDFWYSTTGFNTLSAQNYYKISDSLLKADIQPLEGGLKDILNLRAYTYTAQSGRENEQKPSSNLDFYHKKSKKSIQI